MMLSIKNGFRWQWTEYAKQHKETWTHRRQGEDESRTKQDTDAAQCPAALQCPASTDTDTDFYSK